MYSHDHPLEQIRYSIPSGPLCDPGTVNTLMLEKALEQTILSASGWRKVFAPGGEEDPGSELSPENQALIFAMGWILGDFFSQGQSNPAILLGQDTRPTGAGFLFILAQALAFQGCKVSVAGWVPTPQLLAYLQESDLYHGFVYISASHNPVGHNGLKFGLGDGGVLEGPESSLLKDRLIRGIVEGSLYEAFLEHGAKEVLPEVKEALHKVQSTYEESAKAYESFTRKLWAKGGETEQETFFAQLKTSLTHLPLGIVGEFNGSARALGIDENFLQSLGLGFKAFNHHPGVYVHPIVPEGESLQMAAKFLEEAHREDSSFLLGYVPDCDGDRGNLVYIDAQGNGKVLDAQGVFALSVLSELSHLVYQGQLNYDRQGESKNLTAVVVNGPTSMRIDEICQAFGVKLARCEVGEANVVALAGKLREQGYEVRIFGEGSNGGNITHPARVRDPLNTLGSLIKLLVLGREQKKVKSLYEIACTKLKKEPHNGPLGIYHLIDLLPLYVTTSAYEARALLKIKTQDHGLLKQRYEEIFVRQGWPKQKDILLKEFGIAAWEEVNYEGTSAKFGFGPPFRSGSERGGMSIILKNTSGVPVAFLWMRGSGTEPVFRVMVDLKGEDTFQEEFLLAWHVSMIKQADDISL